MDEESSKLICEQLTKVLKIYCFINRLGGIDEV